MHQAALNVDPANYRSANELGVALAKLRYFEPARAALLQSIATQPTAEAWLNLSSVHRALGETRLADLALAENQAMEGARESDSTVAHSIRWMAPNEFATTQQARYEETDSPSGSPTNIPTAERIPPSPTSESGIWASLKRSFGTH